jgi:2',3'-cyclic-nucleotide 2'-phosphodiesterase (5'-nucleotidase family)
MKLRFLFVVMFAARGWLAANAEDAPAAIPPPALVIYHTNDTHGYAFHENGKDGHPSAGATII